MSKHAIVNNNLVTEVRDISDSEYAELSKSNQLLIDIENAIPEPAVGWILVGNKLQMAGSSLTLDQLDAFQQSAQRKYGLLLLPVLVDKMGARNFKLSREGTPVDVAALATQMASIKLLLETGALKTVRNICNALKPAFPAHADILQYAIDEITNFLISNGWN